ncbi:MAG: ATP-binding protein [Anaerovorax sp.]
MQKQIFKNLLITALVIIVLTTGLMLIGVYSLVEERTVSNMKNEGALIAGTMNYYDDQGYIQSPDFHRINYRLTLIDKKGVVIYDNQVKNLENHSNRPEFIEAMKTGEGSEKRYSGTLEETTYYYAIKLADGTVLRLSDTQDSIFGIFLQIIPLLLGILLLVVVASYIIGRQTTKRFVKPIEQLTDHLDHYNSITLCGYEELVPFVNKINAQREEIKKQIGDLKRDRDTVRTITEHMTEGLIVLDQQKNILSVNHSAIRILEMKGGVFIGKNLIAATRNEIVNRCAERAIEEESVDDRISCHGRYYQIHGCSVRNMGVNIGAMLLLVDVTSEQTANDRRREFTANVSHELKTPLTSISGYAEMMLNGLVPAENTNEFIGKIYKECGRLIILVEDILTLSKLDESAQEEVWQIVNVYDVAKEVVDSLKGEAEKMKVGVKLSGIEQGAVINHASSTMISQLVYNLLSNGIKYNKKGGSVQVNVVDQEGVIKLSVEDTGIGIPESEKDRIFERFYRVDKSRSKNIGGTGLGLSIVKHIVKTIGGSIQLESTEGQGTTVTIAIKK